MYHDNPRRAEPSAYQWYSVNTPQCFLEYKLPVDDRHMTAKHKREYKRLQIFAHRFNATIQATAYRRG